jgi:hypothetical protein
VPLLRVDHRQLASDAAELTARIPGAVEARGTGAVTTSPGPLPDPAGLCCAVARGAVEAIRGDRPVAQLARAVTPEILEALTTRARLVRGLPRPGGGTVPRPVRVRRARVELVGSHTAEATVIVDDVDRVRAAAIRAEAHRGRWRIVALEIG